MRDPGLPPQLHRSPWRRFWAPLLLLALAVFFYAPVLLGLRTFPDGDFTHHFLPFSILHQQELLAARLPRWNPYTYGGHPFLADVQAAVFYPVSVLLLLLTLPLTDAAARLYFLQVEAIIQVALGGIFTYLFVRRLTQRQDAALLAGITFAFSGYLTGYPPVQLAVLRTAIWLPLILWAMLRAVAAPRRWTGWLVVGAAAALCFLAGHPQTFLYAAYTAAAWMLLLLAAHWRTLRSAGNLSAAGLGLLLALATFFGLSAPQLLPSVEFAQVSVRANVDYAYVSGGFPLQDTWQMLIPGVLTQYSPLYVGIIGLGFAFIAVCGALLRGDWRGTAASAAPDATSNPASAAPPTLRERTGVFFFLGLAVVALLLSYGANGFLYPLFYRLVPGFDLFRGQERAAYLVAFGLSVLVGYGLLAARLMPQSVRALLATIYAGLVIAGVYAFGLLWQLPGRTAIGQGMFLLLAALAIALAAAFALLLRLPGWSRERSILLGVLLFAGLFYANFATNLDAPSPAQKALVAPEVEALDTAMTGDNSSGRAYNEYRAYEDYGMRAGVEDVWGSSPLRLARYAVLFDEFPLDRMWRLMGVTHVLTWRQELFEPSTLLAEFPQSTDTTYLHRLTEPNPRAWMVYDTVAADDEHAARLLADHTFDLDTKAILPADKLQRVTLAGASPAVRHNVEMAQLAPGKFALAVQSDTPGLLVIGENWMPGWHVIAREWPDDAAPDAPLRANLTLLGVPVPAGDVAFDLVYAPDSVRIGLWIGGVTLILLLAAGLYARWRGRRQVGA